MTVSVVSRTLGLVLAFFSLGITTRYLGPSEAGEYFTVLAYVGIFAVFADLGLYQTLVRDFSRPGVNESRILSSFFSLRLTSLTFVLGIIAPLVALFLPYSATVKTGIWLGSALFASLSLTTLCIAVFQKHLRMHVVAAGELAGRIVQFMLIYVLLREGYGMLAALASMLAGSALHLAVVYVSAQKRVPFSFRIDTAAWAGIMRVSYPVALSTVFSFIYFKADSLMLSLFKPAHDVGVYGLAYKLLEVLVAYPAIYVGLLVPVFARTFVENREELFTTLRKAFDALMFVALPMFVGGMLLAPRIIPLFGEGYEGAVATLQILLGAVFAIFFGTLYSNVLIATSLQKSLMRMYFWGMVLNVAVNLYVIPRWSYVGAAWTTLATEVGVTLAMVCVLMRHGLLGVRIARFPRMVFATLCMALALVVSPWQSLPALLVAGGAVYLIVSLLAKTYSFAELKNSLRTEQLLKLDGEIQK